MSELRKDIISGRWVIIAAERSKRPDDFRPAAEESKKAPERFCPFCEGNEDKTPPEVYAVRKKGTKANQPGWFVRVVPNKFPALTRGPAPEEKIDGHGLFRSLEGIGVHEVIIESPHHNHELSDLPLAQIKKVIKTYRQRLRKIQAELQYKYIHIFKNKGREAGASLSHPHSQLVATPIVPKKLVEELRSCQKFYDQSKECVFCRLIKEEIRRGDRLIYQNDYFCVLTPFAPRFPFEMRVYPFRHAAWFSEIREAEISGLAEVLKQALGRLRDVLADPAYNFYLHQGPNPNAPTEQTLRVRKSFHWHLEIIPVLTRAAGFEWGTGFYINPVSPEVAANYLRSAGR